VAGSGHNSSILLAESSLRMVHLARHGQLKQGLSFRFQSPSSSVHKLVSQVGSSNIGAHG
jgi:hypothetical protein